MQVELNAASLTTSYPRGFSTRTEWKWPLVPARQLVELNYGKALKADTRVPGAIPVYGTNGQCGWHDTPLAKGPGLILGRKGQGPLGVEWCSGDYWVIDTAYYASTLTPDVRLKYLYHLIKYIGLNHLKDGTSNPTLSRAAFGQQLFPLPNVAEQDAIVRILGSFDARIDLLRTTNITLESIARVLFKSWFVDFDPVHAKREGHAPEGMDEVTAALFPDRFEESTLGRLPQGWRVGKLGELSTLNPESWTSKKHPECVAYIDLANVKDNLVGAVTNYSFDEAPSRARRVMRHGDTIVGTVRPGNRSFAYIHQPIENLTASTGFAVLRPTRVQNTEFVYLAATCESSIEHLAHVADGGAYPAVRPEVVASLECVVPTDEVMAAFHQTTAAIISSVAENERKAQVLCELRDALLPRLISGQLRLPEAETLVA